MAIKNLRLGNKQMEIEDEGTLITIRVGNELHQPRLCIQVHRDMFHEYVDLFKESERLFGLTPKTSTSDSTTDLWKKQWDATVAGKVQILPYVTCNHPEGKYSNGL